jgi:hypothetical protein
LTVVDGFGRVQGGEPVVPAYPLDADADSYFRAVVDGSTARVFPA